MNVFDFDNTIYDGETLIDFALHYVKTDPKIWKYVPKLLIICFKDAFHLFTVEEAIEAYARYAAEVVPTDSNMRGSREYRSHLVEVLSRRALEQLCEEESKAC